MRAAMRMLVGSAVVLTACADTNEPTAPEGGPQASREWAQESHAADQSAIARDVPAFGGMFLDEGGRPTAYVTDLSQAERVRARLTRFARTQGRDASDIVILQAAHSYGQLENVFERATQAAMPLLGTVFTDLDEVRNRVVVGVEAPGLATAARLALQRAGIADDEYEVIVTEPIHHAATLRDRFDPTMGGLQIHFSRYVCTLGANVLDGTQRSFLTNSHCTATQGGVESTVYYQPASSTDGAVIATEVEDPNYFKGGVCPKGKKCRYSDSSRALYASTRASSLGAMAITTGVNTGTLDIGGQFNITGKSNNVVVGTVVNKVGRTTGWTQAPVTRTCVNTSVSGSTIMQLCQTFVSSSVATIVSGGDSGSTVWTGANSITIVGLLWGGSSDNRTFIFSPISQVEQELGTLTFN